MGVRRLLPGKVGDSEEISWHIPTRDLIHTNLDRNTAARRYDTMVTSTTSTTGQLPGRERR
jgi:hypothetical protein